MSYFGLSKQQFLMACRYVTSGIKKVFNMPNAHSRVLTNNFNQQLVHTYENMRTLNYKNVSALESIMT